MEPVVIKMSSRQIESTANYIKQMLEQEPEHFSSIILPGSRYWSNLLEYMDGYTYIERIMNGDKYIKWVKQENLGVKNIT
jgi:hypothetical protein